MKTAVFFFLVFVLQATSTIAQSAQYFSPLNAIPVGPNGVATNKASVRPYCCPSTAIEITSNIPISNNDLQWILIPLNGILEGRISAVTVCYQILGKTTASFISQVRLTEMSVPNSATVRLDDPSHLSSHAPTCYTSKTNNYTVTGTTTLELRIALAPGEKILIGGITILR